jgi:hypothetical protein
MTNIDSRLEAITTLRYNGWLSLNEMFALRLTNPEDNGGEKKGKILLRTSYHDDQWEECEITALRAMSFIKRYFERFPMVYVNAYAVSRRYGGPEEGG